MRYIDEFRDPELAWRLIEDIKRRSTRPVQFMEFCGGHTHAIFKFGLRQMLPQSVRLSSGPGCPVCVTSATDLDRAVALAGVPEAILSTFGDMVRVPGSRGSLQEARAKGADVRVVYSTLDALHIARQNPDRPVIFLGVGFETTAPTVAAAVLQAETENIPNFYVFSVHKLTPPATRTILDAGEVRLNGIIGPGHVTTIIGADAWRFLPDDYGVPCAVAGFEPLDILRAVATLVEMVEEERSAVGNAYGRSVRAEGNRTALEITYRVFEVGVADWRGFGPIPDSGLLLRKEYAHRDAARVFPMEVTPAAEPKGCRCGEVLRGVMDPPECPLFRRVCSPRTPVGPCMVSAEGACAAYYQYGADT
ncbi:MAG: hydrogenase formation protein HypD [Chloroflexota bacterium]|nr:hydrogenase formation protein HypD [Chloroflexota bacterium]